MKKILGIVFTVLLIVAVGVVAVGGKAGAWNFLSSKPAISSEAITATFEDIAELSVEEYQFTRVGKFDDQGHHILGKHVPLTNAKFIAVYSGTVQAGLEDFSAIKTTIDDAAKTIIVTTPAVTVTDVHIDPKSIEQYDQTLNPFNQINVSDMAKFLEDEERTVTQEAIDNGLLQRATTRLDELLVAQLAALLLGTDKADYTITVNHS